MKLNHFTIGQRLSVMAAILLLATMFVGLRGITLNAEALQKNNDIMASETRVAQSIDTARNAQVQFKIQVQEWKNTLLRGTQGAETFEKYKAAFLTQSDKTAALLNQLLLLQPALGMDTAQVKQTLKLHAELQQKYLAALQSYDIHNLASAQLVDRQVSGIDREPTKMIDDVVHHTLAHAEKLNQQLAAQNLAQFASTRMTLWIAMAAILLSGVLITVWLIRSITHPLREAVNIARTVASGDLQTVIRPSGRDETAELMTALREMNSSLTSIVSGVRSGTETIASASIQIAQGSQELSSRNEAQAGALEETAASMEELTSVVKNNAQNARHASDIAQDARSIAGKGGNVVEKVVHTMSEIHQFSNEINQIITVIDGIAFQTNILALNAAVEAARAGSEGRGFAVVAAEVRALAQRSAKAAQDVRILIDRSVNSIGQGNELVQGAGTTMEEIILRIRQVSELIENVSAASNEQSVGIDQVNLAVTHMDAATQQNAALSQQSTAAAQALQAQAETLLASVSVFKLNPALAQP
ncbi:methyl-accepting chemotaxis protein (plasmid) [Duffyella gerundensis]|jgi:methyl-accepting chemotaxis protein|uniref:Chemotaxis protein n=1 Tax=Duffyella gerundensis TaxID=1619313 RepID=A0A0U5LAL2_9GAMM|nr:methyl-accepting chemotaxis protein [Duffyella gerundensis]UCB33021.1 methyl-accepting chemotaxis protein [Duffyella gerundensis]CUU26219.1 chemotaxis protein [Duffyella gerundensis]